MPPLTLHVLPPAFFLPSISPDCVTAIAYLRYTQPYDSWIVVADAAEHPHLVAPFLIPARHDLKTESQPVEGLDAILHHLSTTNNGAAQLKSSLTNSEKAQALALSSHLQTRLWPLVALSLYANSANYASATRPGFAAVLALPESWILPHQLHKSAVASCAHLGIDPKDLDLLMDGSTVKQHSSVAHAGPFTPDNAPKQDANTKTDPSVAAKVQIRRRIDDLVYAALAPLLLALGSFKDTDASSASKMTGNTVRWLFSASHPTFADLTALSLLSLAVLPYSGSSVNGSSREPALSNPFLTLSIERQFPRLISSYLLPGLEDAFAGRTLSEHALQSAQPAGSVIANGDERDDYITEGYDNMNIGNGRASIPWRRKQNADSWHDVQRVGIAFGAVFAEAIGLRS